MNTLTRLRIHKHERLSYRQIYRCRYPQEGHYRPIPIADLIIGASIRFTTSPLHYRTSLPCQVHSLDDLIQAHKNFIDKTIFRLAICCSSIPSLPAHNYCIGIKLLPLPPHMAPLHWYKQILFPSPHHTHTLLHCAHTTHTTALCTRRCLLSKKARPVMNIIHGIFSSVLKFGEQLTLSTSPPQRRYQAMCDTHLRDFRKAATLLITGAVGRVMLESISNPSFTACHLPFLTTASLPRLHSLPPSLTSLSPSLPFTLSLPP